MERGFYHPNRGYWQTVGAVSQEVIDAYPQGTVEVPLKPGADYDLAGGKWVYVQPALVVPSSCSPLQMRRALRQLGYKTAVDAYIAQQTEEVQEAWEYATVIERSDPLMADAIALLSAQLGLDAQTTGDALFTLAVTL